MNDGHGTEPVAPSLRSRSVVLALIVGLLLGAMSAALLGGRPARLAPTGADGIAQTDGGPGVPSAPTAAGSGAAAPSAGGLGSPTAAGPAGAGGGAATDGAGATSSTPPTDGAGGRPPQGRGKGQPSVLGVSCSKLDSAGVRGVTPTTIKIGIGLADLTLLEPVLGPAAQFGPQQQIFDAVLKALSASNPLPCGRKIVPVYEKYQVLTEAQSRAVCQSFINDEKVFAVITTFSFRSPLCVTQENKTFLIDQGYQLYNDDFAQSGGRLFGLDPPVDIWYRLWTSWVIERLAKKPGAKLGVYYNTSNPERVAVVQADVLDVLKAHGITPVVATSNAGAETLVTGDPNDPAAVLKFKSAGVTDVMMSVENFMQQAQREDYHPRYYFAGSDAEDANSGRFDATNGDGAQGLVWDRVNDYSRGVAPTADQERCVRYATDAGIARPRPEYGQWNLTMIACDELGIVIKGIIAAGANLTTDRLVLGVRTVTSWPGYFVAAGGFTASKNWLIDESREAQYYGACSCWKNTTDFAPLGSYQ
ncbi:MAG TPA: hypothetical protein VHE83_00390 [Mycobacteriales bacterium]|nr:hypothetical protein [Mycobacteriales bacterium]